MISPARSLSYEVLCEIQLREAHSDNALHAAMDTHIEWRDRNLATEIVYGTLRWLGWLDYVLADLASRGWDKVEEELRILLRMSLYQIWRTERIPDYAVVNDAVELAKRSVGKGSSSFVNAILRRAVRERPWLKSKYAMNCAPWIRASLPEWIWKRWAGRYGESVAFDYAISLNQAPQAAVRRASIELLDIENAAESKASDLVPGAYLLPGGLRSSPGIKLDGLRVQDEASQLIPFLLEPIKGLHVWDACAAPGGKSAILKEMCGPSGFVVSSDLAMSRAWWLRQNLSRIAGASMVLAANAASPPFLTNCFDAVLADVPCSGLGTLRRNPEIKWRLRPERLGEMNRMQSAILGSLAMVVKKGGRLLYSTCSTEPEENEQVVEGFLNTNPQFHLQEPIRPAGIKELLDTRGMLHTCPSRRNWDGFFGALMVRES